MWICERSLANCPLYSRLIWVNCCHFVANWSVIDLANVALAMVNGAFGNMQTSRKGRVYCLQKDENSNYYQTWQQPRQPWLCNLSSMLNILHLMFALRQGLPNFNFPIGKMTVVGPLGSSSSQIKSIPRTTDRPLPRSRGPPYVMSTEQRGF